MEDLSDPEITKQKELKSVLLTETQWRIILKHLDTVESEEYLQDDIEGIKDEVLFQIERKSNSPVIVNVHINQPVISTPPPDMQAELVKLLKRMTWGDSYGRP